MLVCSVMLNAAAHTPTSVRKPIIACRRAIAIRPIMRRRTTSWATRSAARPTKPSSPIAVPLPSGRITLRKVVCLEDDCQRCPCGG